MRRSRRPRSAPERERERGGGGERERRWIVVEEKAEGGETGRGGAGGTVKGGCQTG